MRRLLLGLGAVLAVAVGAMTWMLWSDDTDDDAPDDAGPAATATVTKGSLAATDTWDGTLERGSASTVRTGAPGTITRLAAQGQAVVRGDVLFRLDEQPVVLLTGVVPMYRDLAPGASGLDVEQLEGNLALLGYSGFTVDDDYTAATAAAVRKWQAALGAMVTGRAARGSVLFVPEAGQVQALRAAVGDVVVPGAPVLDLAGTDQVVVVEAGVEDLDRFDVGTEVTVDLPATGGVPGKVTNASVVEGAGGGAMEGAAAGTEQVLQVEIALGEQAPDELVGASVEVVAAVDRRTDVLVVPVNALLARSAGGYGLEVVADDGSTSIVPVETGLFAEGKVELTSGDVREGTVVGVAGR